MAKVTPEGKVKKQLLDLLKSFDKDCFYYMPVQNGTGQSGIPDVMAIIHGKPFAFECKATPKQDPTSLQAMRLQEIHNAGGFAFVVDNESINLVKLLLDNMDLEGEFGRRDAEAVADMPEFSALYRWRKKLEVMEFEQ